MEVKILSVKFVNGDLFTYNVVHVEVNPERDFLRLKFPNEGGEMYINIDQIAYFILKDHE